MMNKTAERVVTLDKGRVDVYTENGITLYAYQTCDPIDNEVFVLTRNGRGVVIELPCFYDNIRELTDFLAAEGIRVEGKLVAYHAAGASFLPEVPAYGTASSVAYNTTGGGAALVANFKSAFGDSFDAGLCPVDRVMEEGEVEIAVETVRQYQARSGSEMKVIFNVFKDTDREIYERLLREA